MRGSDSIDIESRLESLITRVGEKVGLETMAVTIWVYTVLSILHCGILELELILALTLIGGLSG